MGRSRGSLDGHSLAGPKLVVVSTLETTRRPALEQLLDAAFDETGDERLDPGERIVSVTRKGLDPLVGEEAFDEWLRAPDVGPGEVDLARQAPGVVCRPCEVVGLAVAEAGGGGDGLDRPS
jgi:hypothetical protein